MSVPDDSEVKLDQVIKKSETGLVFYRFVCNVKVRGPGSSQSHLKDSNF